MAKDKGCFEDALKHLRKKGHFVLEEKGVAHLKTDIVGLDWLLGGGVPLGRIMEVYGFEQSGKTTLALEIAKCFQQYEKRVVYMDYEHAVDLDYAEKIGVTFDEEVWLYDMPTSLEEGMDAAMSLMETKEVGIVLVDSVAAMAPIAELEGAVSDFTIGLQARKMGQTLRKMVGLANKTDTTVIFINQLREKIGQSFGRVTPTTTPGGRALKFYSSIRLETKKAWSDKLSDNTSLHRVILRKQKTAMLQKGTIEFEINQYGVDRDEHLIQMLANFGVIQNRSGSYFLEDGEKLCRGRDELKKVMLDLDTMSSLQKALEAKFNE